MRRKPRTTTLHAMTAAVLAACLLGGCGNQAPVTARDASSATSATPPATSTASETLQHLLDEHWQYSLQHNPEFASMLGDARYNDRWTDYSLAGVAADEQATRTFAERLRAIDSNSLDMQQRVSQQMLQRELDEHLESIALKNHLMLLEQSGGVHLNLPGYVSVFPFETAKHFQDYAARLRAVPALVDQVVEASREGVKAGLVPPRHLLEKVALQARDIAEPGGRDSAFASPLEQFPDSIPEAERALLREAILTAIDGHARPAYSKLAEFVTTEYAPQGREHPGLWSLPDGERRYAFAVRRDTTTNKTADEIHAIGLSEVARIEAEMLVIAKTLGFADLAALRAAVASDPARFATSREQILDGYRGYIARIEPQLPKWFGTLPKTPIEVRSIEAFREASAPGAQYFQSTPEGIRPGIVMVNTGDFARRTLVNIETTAYHEGLPGHHMQISLAQTLPLPTFRQQGGHTAYVEGWALYSERLAKEMGFFTDPYSDYGRLCGELLRANRLVLDTGVHHKRWTREQMVAFFHAHPSDDEPSIQSETDRYIAWPGQALGYKMGQLAILDMRTRAQASLGERFDIRAFHDHVLGGGAMPLDLLDARVQAWVTAQQP